MKVRIADLPAHQQITLGTEFVRSAIAELPMRQALERPADDPDAGQGEADLELYADGANVFVRGTARGWIEVACSRCVGTARVDFAEKVAVTFMPRAQVPEDDPDGELEVTEDDIDVFPYDDDEVNLEPLLREQIILAIPYAPLCRPDCRGLCSVCGADLNAGECGCDRAVIDPRLAALKDIKL